jgi:hypothetical protein
VEFLDALDAKLASLRADLAETPTLTLYLSISHRIDEARESLKRLNRSYNARNISSRRDDISNQLILLEKQLLEIWKPVVDNQLGGEKFDCKRHYDRPIDSYTPLTQLLMLLAAIIRVITGLSRRDSEFILHVIIIAITYIFNHDHSRTANQTIMQTPTTMDTLLAQFSLDGECVQLAVCVECNCTYQPNAGNRYPTTCTNKPTPESECNASLLTESGKPKKLFDHHVFADYVAGLMSREDIECEIDRSCDHFLEGKVDSSYMSSPFDATFLKDFIGPSGHLFCDRQGEARLMFSLCVDFFNPEGTSRRGKHTSIGIISVACLNLPGDIRYRPENMWVDIIPGPHEPTLTELNHYLRPLVDDMLVSWNRGFKLSRTASEKDGRLARCAIVIGVCDLPAARKTAAFAPHGHKIFCHVCDCWHAFDNNDKRVKDLDLLRRRADYREWKRRDVNILREVAGRWRTASSVAEQDDIFEEYGLRWSELWRLPYWDPTRMLVVDSMHCLLEGLARFHTLKVLRLSEGDAKSRIPRQPAFTHPFRVPHVQDENVSKMIDSDAEDDPAEDESSQARSRPFGQPWTRKDVKDVLRIHTILTAPYVDAEVDEEDNYTTNSTRLTAWLTHRSLDALKYVADELKLNVVGSGTNRRPLKINFAQALIAWVSFRHRLSYRLSSSSSE